MGLISAGVSVGMMTYNQMETSNHITASVGDYLKTASLSFATGFVSGVVGSVTGGATGAITSKVFSSSVSVAAQYATKYAVNFGLETLGDAFVQKVTTGEVNWKQAVISGALDTVIGASVDGVVAIVKNWDSVKYSAKSLWVDETGAIDLSQFAKKSNDTGNLSYSNAKDIIAKRTIGLDLTPHPVTYKQLSSKRMSELKSKIDNRSITRTEYKEYIWNKKIDALRRKGVKSFWDSETERILSNNTTTRDWTESQKQDILSGKVPTYNGRPMQGHHTYSVSQYPHLADVGDIIWPATFNEHLNGWHGGSWNKSLPGRPIKDIRDF